MAQHLVAPAVVDHVHDGDTLVVVVSLGFGVALKSRVRLAGINAPENNTPAGQQATVYAWSLAKPGDMVTVTSAGHLGCLDNYGRVLAAITLSDGRDWATEMINAGHAVVMNDRGAHAGREQP